MEDKLDPEDREKSLYLTQIRCLDEQLERCQLKCDELEKQNKTRVSLHSALQKDKEDITGYLTYTAAKWDRKVEELLVQLEKQQQAAEQLREALKVQHSLQELDLQVQMDKVNSVRTRNVEMLEEQEQQREQLMEQLQQLPNKETLEKQLVQEEEEHQATIQTLETDKSLNNDKMTIEAIYAQVTNEKISQSVHKERAQHSKLQEKVKMMMKVNMTLFEHRETLRGSVGKLSSENNKLRHHLDIVTNEVFTYEKESEKLTKKCRQLKRKLKDRSISHKLLLAEQEALRLSVALLSEDCCEKEVEAALRRTQLQEESRRRRQLEADIQGAVSFLRHILKNSETLSERNTKRLLGILERTTPQGTDSGPQGTDFLSEASDPKPARVELQDFSTDPLFQLAHYRPGDLGFIPRPTWKLKPAFSRTRLPLNSQKTSSSIDPSALAPQQEPSAP